MDEYENRLRSQGKTAPSAETPSETTVNSEPGKAKLTKPVKPPIKVQGPVKRAKEKPKTARAPQKSAPSSPWSGRYNGAYKTD
jgi:hypothetical protein